jgi:hypothetical protein
MRADYPCRVKEKLLELRMRSMEFDDAIAAQSASPSSPGFACRRFSPAAALPASGSTSHSPVEVAAGSASFRSGLFEVSAGTFSSARVLPLSGSQ